MYNMNPMNRPMTMQLPNTSMYSVPMGRWAMVNNLNEVQTTPIPADGTQMLFMLKDEPILYMVSMVEGQRMIQGFTIAPLVMDNIPQQNTNDTIESRMSRLENSIAQLMEALGEKKEG
jgi:hypothetical protein